MDADVERVVASVLDTFKGNMMFLSPKQRHEVTVRILTAMETQLRDLAAEPDEKEQVVNRE